MRFQSVWVWGAITFIACWIIPLQWPEALGFAGFGAPIPIIFAVQGIGKSLWRGFAWGMVGGTVLWGSHFVWIISYLQRYGTCNFYAILIAWLLGVGCMSIGCIIWGCSVAVMGHCKSGCVRLMGGVGLWILTLAVCQHIGLWWTGELQGYPFANPLLAAVAWMYPPSPLQTHIFWRNLHWVHLLSRAQWPFDAKDLVPVAYFMYRQLLDGSTTYADQPTIFCAAETAFPYSFDDAVHWIKVWQQALPRHSAMIVGSQLRNDAQQLAQGAFVIMFDQWKVFTKGSCVPFFEDMPGWWRHSALARNIALNGRRGFIPVLSTKKPIFMGPLPLICFVCSEFFCAHQWWLLGPNVIGCLLVNDIFFPPSMRFLMRAYAHIIAYMRGSSLIYIAPDGCALIGYVAR